MTTLFGGILSDRIGRPPTYLIGFGFQLVWAIPMFLMIGAGNMFLIGFSVLVSTTPIGLSYGPQFAMHAVSYAFCAILGGAFSHTIAQYLVGSMGWIGLVGVSLAILAVISGSAVLTIKEPRGTLLTPERDEAQEK